MTANSLIIHKGQPQRMTRANSDQTLIESWIRLRKSEGTRKTYEKSIKLFVEWLGSRSLSELTVDDLADYRDSLAVDGLSLHTAALRLKVVKSLLAYGHKVGYLAFDVGRAVQPDTPPNELAQRILEEWQVMAILNHPKLKERDRMLLRLLYVSGARVSEITGLQWRHVQPSNGSGQITVMGKGQRTRAIKLSSETWRTLLAFKPADADADDYVFQSQRKGGQEARRGKLDNSAVNRIIQKAGKLIGIENVSPHWLRHSHASHALDKGAPISLVGATLGHSSVAVTSRYLHAKPGESSSTYLNI